ncbi:MAG: putative sugar nucleotidyl transferase, partial [Bacteroidia bacterium]
MKLVLFDDQSRKHFLPLAFTRPVCEFRIGIRTIREKWEHILNAPSTTYCADYLTARWPFQPAFDTDNIWINSRVIPSLQLASEVKRLQVGEALLKGDLLVAANVGLNSIVLKLGTSDHLT